MIDDDFTNYNYFGLCYLYKIFQCNSVINSFRNVFSKHRGEKGPEIENETASKRNTFNENLKGPSICSGWGIPSYSVAEFKKKKNFPRRIKIKLVDIGEKLTFHGKL